MIEVLTLPAIARALGVRRDTARALCERGEVPAIRHGKGWRVPRSTLEQHLHDKAVREAAERRASVSPADAAPAMPARARGRRAQPAPDLSGYP
jgi:excisionase family DNA binding protein